MQEDETTPQRSESADFDAPVTSAPRRRHSKLWCWLAWIVTILLLAAVGFLGWLVMDYRDDKKALEADKRNLQSQVSELEGQLAAAESTESESETTCDGTVADATKDAIADAVNSGNYAALETYMADAVNSVLAASEKGGNVAPAQAVTDLEYLSTATGPWDFALDATTLASYAEGDYSDYFGGNEYVGQSSDGYVVSFGFDDCGKIDHIFISPSADLL